MTHVLVCEHVIAHIKWGRLLNETFDIINLDQRQKNIDSKKLQWSTVQATTFRRKIISGTQSRVGISATQSLGRVDQSLN